MFERLGQIVERRWIAILVVWATLLAASGVIHGWYKSVGLKIPGLSWREVAQDGEFAFLPSEMQSLRGEQLLAQAFPEDLLKSSIVIVVRRYKPPILPEDEQFIEEVLRPRLEQIRDEIIKNPKLQVKTFTDPLVGRMLVSENKQASLVVMPLDREFLEWSNVPTIKAVEKLIQEELAPLMPVGLDLAMSGSATVGRDMLVASAESADATEKWTTILVVFLLIVIYQAPLLALIPLITVFASVQISLALVTLLTQVPVLHYRIFFGLEVYITVVVYGTGVDYCLFLVARYKEELDRGLSLSQGIAATLGHVGAALTASALTVICGIGMLVFAQFGKFREAGIGISLSLIIGWLAAMTLTPALLRLAGRGVFWPRGRGERIAAAGAISGTSLIARLVERGRFQVLWEKIGSTVMRRPGRILALCVVGMVPFAAIGLYYYDFLSYGLLSELPPTRQSVLGAKAVQEHFPAGYAGPLTILIRNENVDFRSGEGGAYLEALVDLLASKRVELGISDIRYSKLPLGLKYRSESESVTNRGLTNAVLRKKGKEYYVSSAKGFENHVTRMDVIFEADPFARESIAQLTKVEQTINAALDTETLEPLKGSQFNFIGPTASIRDLKTVTDRDQIKIDILVLIGVFLILIALLRKPAISLYLIVSVFFSYFVTLGVTYVFYFARDPEGFSGLDWKVPMFLFTILIAIGEDYNIFLMTRIEEEQRRHGLIEGIRIAMLRTGTIISSCGIIMAGTFLSLFAGTLVGLQQLGFALAFGVLLDTFVVRPLLVPAYLVLLYSGKFGPLSRLLGGVEASAPAVRPAKTKVTVDV